ncbi:hypothetical protein EKG40_08280 [Pseudomonas moorei]|nr:hypothetical protein EKG40_08280 [Pseudomonas moorei]
MSTSEFESGSPEQPKPEVPPPMEIPSNPLAHLSSAQIEEMYLRYLAGDKTSDLIREYEINTNLNSLLKLLPLIPREDLVCPYCASPASQRRRAKAGPKVQPTCTGCSHVYESADERCGCEGCRSAYVHELNAEGMQRRVPYTELTIREKIILLSALSMTNDFNRASFSIYQLQRYDPKFAPTPALHTKCQNELFHRKIILVSEETTHSSLEFYRKYDHTDFLLWRPNVSFNNEMEESLEIDLLQMLLSNDLSTVNPDYATPLIELMYELSIEEAMEYLGHQVSLSNVNFKAWVAARTTLRSLLPSKSISEIFGFIWVAVKDAERAIGRKNINGATHAGNLIPTNISQAAEAFETRPPKHAYREFYRLNHLKPCELSNTIYELILGDKDGAFKIPLPRYIDEIMRPTLEGIATAQTAKFAYE